MIIMPNGLALAHRCISQARLTSGTSQAIGLRSQAPGCPGRDRGPGLHLRQHRPVRFRRLLDPGLHGHVHRRVPAGAVAGDLGPPHHGEPAGTPCRASPGSAMTAVTPGTAAAATMTAIAQDEYGTAPGACSGSPRSPGPRSQATRSWCGCVRPAWTRGPWHLMAGLPYPMRLAGFGPRKPKATNPGRSLAATVESAGQQVTGLEPGDEVYGTCGGSFAPYARARADRLAPSPRTCPSRRPPPSPSPRSPPCRPCGTRHRYSPGRRS
jgi:hypothetical protein